MMYFRSGCPDGKQEAAILFELTILNDLGSGLRPDDFVQVISEPMGFAPSWWPYVREERRVLRIWQISAQRELF